MKKTFVLIALVGMLLMTAGCSFFGGISDSTVEKYIADGIDKAIEEYYVLPEGTNKTTVSYNDIADMVGEELLDENGNKIDNIKLTFTAFKDPQGKYLYIAGPNEMIIPTILLKAIGWDQKHYTINIWKVNDEQTTLTDQFEIYLDLKNEGALLPQTLKEYTKDGYTEYKYFGLREYSLKNEITTDKNKWVTRKLTTIDMLPVYKELADEGTELSGDYVTITERCYEYDADGRVVKEKATLLKDGEAEEIGMTTDEVSRFLELFYYESLRCGESREKTYIYYPDAPLQEPTPSGFEFFTRDDGLEVLTIKTTYPNGKPMNEEEYHYDIAGKVIRHSEKCWDENGELTEDSTTYYAGKNYDQLDLKRNNYKYSDYYKNDENWDADGCLYFEDILLSADKLKNGKLIVKKGTKRIWTQAFEDNEILEELVLPSGIEEIHEFALLVCPNLKTVYLPAMQQIDYNIFMHCDSLADIYYDGTFEELHTALGTYGFYLPCEDEARLHLNDGVFVNDFRGRYYGENATEDD